MSTYKVMGWYQYRVYKYIEADSKEQAIDIACQGNPLHEWNLEINQGAYREEVESAEEDNSDEDIDPPDWTNGAIDPDSKYADYKE